MEGKEEAEILKMLVLMMSGFERDPKSLLYKIEPQLSPGLVNLRDRMPRLRTSESASCH